MADLDSYFLKCSLELMEEGIDVEEIQYQCECQFGITEDEADTANY